VPMTEAPYSITFKTPRGNLFTIRGNDARELGVNLNAAPEEGLLALISQIEIILSGQAGGSGGGTPARVGPASTAAEQPSALTQAVSQELPSGFGTPKCIECGGETRFAQEGISKKSGKPYKRYACVVNQLHKSTFT
jgi:hypothetical protein